MVRTTLPTGSGSRLDRWSRMHEILASDGASARNDPQRGVAPRTVMMMRCHVCNVAVGDGQRFCHECGETLDGVTNPTEPLEFVPDAETDAEADATPVTAASLEAPTIEYPAPDDGDDAVVSSDDLPTIEFAAAVVSSDPVDPAETEALAPPAATSPDDQIALTPTGAVGVLGAASASSLIDGTGDQQTAAMSATAGPPARALGDTNELPGQYAGAPIFDGVGDVAEYTVPPSDGFRLRASFVFGFLAMVATLMASVADVIDIRTSRPVDGISVGIQTLEDFGTNLPIAGFVGAAVMLIGGLLSCFGLRSGAGIAGGSGLALAGWSAMTIGLVEVPIHSAEGITRNTGADINGFTLAITRDLGWFLILSIGILGIIVFLTTLRMAGSAGRPGLNPWVAALGALGAVILASGPLIPLSEATFDLNLGFVGLPRAFFIGRSVLLGLVAFSGVVGFLSVRTYGLGLAGGGLSIATWLWATSLADVGDSPVGVAVGNLGTVDTSPHAVTTVGLALALMMLLVASALAIVDRPRR
jgi:hypothetical protein